MASFICEYCDKSFVTKSNLSTHTKTAKFCLKLRGSDNFSSPVCEFCDQEFTQKSAFQRHLETCKFKKVKHSEDTIYQENQNFIKEINTLNNTVKSGLKKTKEFEKIVKRLTKENARLKEELAFEKGQNAGYEKVKPANVIHQYVNPKLKFVPTDNILPLTNETIELSLPKYTYEDFNRTKKGLVAHLLKITIFEDEDGVINKNYVCTNRARNSFHILVNDKKWTQDNGATYIHTYLNLLRPQILKYVDMFEEEVTRMQDHGDPLDMIIIRKRKDKIDSFKWGFRSEPGDEPREKLLTYVRACIRDHLYI